MPVINLSYQDLDTKPFKYGLPQFFTDKDKFVKRKVAVELETLAASLDHYIEQSNKESFHKYLRSCTDIIKKVSIQKKMTLLHCYKNSGKIRKSLHYQQIKNPAQ